jgi:nicotinamide-nucleotide adenylyltransferase
MSEKDPLGVIHGRFQVLHNGHMEYLLAGKQECDFLVVGITNPDPALTAHHESNPHRSLPMSNPFTFYERAVMTRNSLREAGLGWDEFMVVPLPINKPEVIVNYVPTDAVFYLTIYDDWGRAKLKTLQSLNLKTHVLWERALSEKPYNSTDIRRKIASGEPWEDRVPAAVAKYIKENGLDERLRALLAGDEGD